MMAPHAEMAKVAPRLGQLIRMLSSTSDGETLNAARALGRTLAAAKLDFNDLASVIEDRVVPFVYKPPPRSNYRPDPRPAEPPKPAKPKPEPKPWPTWGTMKHSQYIAWLDVIEVRQHLLERKELAEFIPMRRQVITAPHEFTSRKRTNLFNRLVQRFWLLGVRI